ncbi:iron ABC transporter substrate-binding protein [Desulfurispira natronophila]|uniref:Iron complex transport system substrate-binding protein n=1 Tax=Desulfurispira natronophila TaxID=682562 RepID=A0A7W7Y4H5_9BACT|nr:iron ABC transporter substrate-binding protein [Desulfurispira natronophila]MBB5021926.1 iron complex transport system substrate-binding protein [Desulfurispira natronophila]
MAHATQNRTITDAMQRQITIPSEVQHVICSGPGCLRLLTYLQAQHMIVGVDSIEVRGVDADARPYAMANPQFANYPVFGEFRGNDNPELVISLDPLPDVILKTYPEWGHDPVQLQQKTGIPVVTFNYGDLTGAQSDLYDSLRLMGKVVGKQERAEAVIAFFENTLEDVQERMATIDRPSRSACYVGGIAMRGGRGFESTMSSYTPFELLGITNLAAGSTRQPQASHAVVSQEQILAWDPACVFLDVSTSMLQPENNGLRALRKDPSYANLSAVQNNTVRGLLPFNSYTQNFGSILANVYYIGSELYPEAFHDIDPTEKADEIYRFLVGKPILGQLEQQFGGLVFQSISTSD